VSRGIAKFEKNTNWQATATYGSGRLTAIMRGVLGGPFEGNYYLYDEDWSPAHAVAQEMTPHSLAEIRRKFASGELTLVCGGVP